MSRRRSFHCTSLLHGLLFCSVATVAATPGYALAAEAALARWSFDIPAGNLGTALSSLAAQSGVLLSFDAALTANLRTPGLTGRYSLDEGLARLLAGSGLEAQRRDDGSYGLTRRADATAASSASPPERTAMQLDPMVVTGELLRRSRQESQASVEAYTGEMLDRSAAGELVDLAERTPNVIGNGHYGFSIRGVDQRGAGGRGQLLSVNVDGITLPSNDTTFYGPYGLWDIGQVEFLRGPQSTQRGRNALAGAIVVRSADPVLGTQQGKVRLGIAELGGYRVAGAINQPLGDALAARISFEDMHSDGSVKNSTLGQDDYSPSDLQTGRFKVLWAPTETFELGVNFSRVDFTHGDDSILLSKFPQERVNDSDVEGAGIGSLHRFGTVEWAWTLAPDWRLESVSGMYRGDFHYYEDGFFGNGLGPTPGLLFLRTAQDESFEQDLRLYHHWTGGRAVMGLYATRSEQDRQTLFSAPAALYGLPGDVGRLVDRAQPQTENYAAFGEASFDLDAVWTLTAGLRYDNETATTVRSTTISVDPPQEGFPTVTEAREESRYDAFLPKLGVSARLGEDALVDFTVQQAYRAGGYSLSLFSGEGGEYDPEFATNYELAVRSLWLERRLSANLNTFFMDWRDQQVEIVGSSGNPNDVYVDNAGRSRVYGIEAQLDWRVWRDLVLGLSAAWTRTEFIEFVFNGMDVAGNRFPFSPDRSASVYAEWNPYAGWFGTVSFSAVSGFYSDPVNSPDKRVPGRGLVGLRGGYRGQHWALSAYARNATDRDYLIVRDGAADFAEAGEPRVAGLELDLWW